MNKGLVIRKIVKDDYRSWKILWDGYNAFYGRAGATALPESTTRHTWQCILDPAEPVFGLFQRTKAICSCLKWPFDMRIWVI